MGEFMDVNQCRDELWVRIWTVCKELMYWYHVKLDPNAEKVHYYIIMGSFKGEYMNRRNNYSKKKSALIII